MIIGRLETRNFSWTTLTNTPEEAIENLKNAWDSHAINITGYPWTWEELEDSATLEPINVGSTLSTCTACENLAHNQREERS